MTPIFHHTHFVDSGGGERKNEKNEKESTRFIFLDDFIHVCLDLHVTIPLTFDGGKKKKEKKLGLYKNWSTYIFIIIKIYIINYIS